MNTYLNLLDLAEIKPVPTDAELIALETYTQSWVFEDVVRHIPLRYCRTMARRASTTDEWQFFVHDTFNTYGDAGMAVITDVLNCACDEYVAHRRSLRKPNRRSNESDHHDLSVITCSSIDNPSHRLSRYVEE